MLIIEGGCVLNMVVVTEATANGKEPLPGEVNILGEHTGQLAQISARDLVT